MSCSRRPSEEEARRGSTGQVWVDVVDGVGRDGQRFKLQFSCLAGLPSKFPTDTRDVNCRVFMTPERRWRRRR
jgi:hypothetical protein